MEAFGVDEFKMRWFLVQSLAVAMAMTVSRLRHASPGAVSSALLHGALDAWRAKALEVSVIPSCRLYGTAFAGLSDVRDVSKRAGTPRRELVMGIPHGCRVQSSLAYILEVLRLCPPLPLPLPLGRDVT